ncbi:rod shape-determining protein MreD [Halalkalibacillus halophilus]|uniref:rod shape-determining protein MreD n=1 Tax=Halalkalibacillus halophilus TaxID=392827 RepID=UPI00040D11CE|nr:rod shape-determining protein MreD [Halalkalibacillus halophilus]
MKVLLLPLVLFTLLVLESVAIGLIPDQWWLSSFYLIPHWILIFATLIVVFYDRENSYTGLIYGLIFAFLVDLVYTNILGVYLLAYSLALYTVHTFKKFFHQNFLVTLLMAVVAIVIAEFIIFSLYTLIGQVSMEMNDFVINRMLPTLFVNLVFLVIIYPIFSKKLFRWKEELLK